MTSVKPHHEASDLKRPALAGSSGEYPVALYEDFVYDNFPFSDTHPDWLGTVASLFGIDAAPVERCRVLELGCGLGGNLLPHACLLPHSSFVGVDLSTAQIRTAREDVSALGLSNIRFDIGDLRNYEPDGLFDYIVCHGVYSWVPKDVQARILELCAQSLAPRGVAMISFNTLPGWHARGMVRDLLRRFVPKEGTGPERALAARNFLRFLAAHAQPMADPAVRYLKSELELVERLSDAYLVYEHLVDDNEALWFSDFVKRIKDAGLDYVGDAELERMLPERLGPEGAEAVRARAADQVEAEQLLDVLSVRFFRRAILCRAGETFSLGLSGERLSGTWLSSSLRPVNEAPNLVSGDPESFALPGGTRIMVSDPALKLALVRLAAGPRAGMRFESLFLEAPSPEEVSHLGGSLLRLLTMGYLRANRWRRPFAEQPSGYPQTSALARLQASRDQAWATNLAHQSVPLDRFDRALLARLDGTQDLETLLTNLVEDALEGRVVVEVGGQPTTDRVLLAEVMEAKLAYFAESALLLA